jgi:hypothetical protein
VGNYYINEHGQVGVLITRGYGTGWFTYHWIWRLCVDAELCRAIDDGELELALDLAKEIADHEGTVLLNNVSIEDIQELEVCWTDRHRKFFIHEYDGLECVWYKDEIDWIQL